jgi:MFS family permease
MLTATSSSPAERRFPFARRNFLLFLFDYMLFGAAFALVSPSSVIPDFINKLTDNEIIIGLAGAVHTILWLAPQLLFAQVVARRTRRQPFLLPAIPARLMALVFAVIIFTSGGDANPILLGFFAFSILFWIGDGLVTITWADLLGSTLTASQRSMLYTIGQLGVAVGALAAREVIRVLLGDGGSAFPGNYGTLFLIAGSIFVMGGVCLAFIREPEANAEIQPGPTLRQFLPYIGQVMKTDGAFRHFAIMRLFFDFSTMAVPFYIILGTDVLGQSNSTLVGDSILLVTLSNAALSILNGWLSRRQGPSAVLRFASLFKIALPGLALLAIATGSVTALHAAFFTIGAINGSYGPGYFDWVITHAPNDRRPIYIGLTNTISAVGNISPFIGGFILNFALSAMNQPKGAAQGPAFAILFSCALVMTIIGAVMSLALADPHGRVASRATPASA